jgi:ribosomal protein S12 methylthiotransferase accessory factor
MKQMASCTCNQVGKKLHREGTHRTYTPAQTLARVRPYMAAMGITRIANLTGLDRLGIPVVGAFRPNSKSVAVAQGKGLTLDAAKASGLMEAVETFHAETTDAPRFATLEMLQRDCAVVDVERLPRASNMQLPRAQSIPWLCGKDWHTGEPMWVPYELVSTDYTLPFPPGTGYFQANTNGLASGNCMLEAVLHGLCELIERDATALWWRRAIESKAACAVDLDRVTDSGCQWVLEKYAEAGVKVSVWNTTTDLAVASFLCAVYGKDPPLPEFGAGCHPCREIALMRALTEAAQARTTFIAGSRDDIGRRCYASDLASARLNTFRALMDGDGAPVRFGDVPTVEFDTVADDLEHVTTNLARGEMRQIIVFDLTKHEFNIPVVRVVVPGLEGLIEENYLPGTRAQARAA